MVLLGSNGEVNITVGTDKGPLVCCR